MDDELEIWVLSCSGADRIVSVDTLQQLWSGYGHVRRLHLSGGQASTLVLKDIDPPAAPAHPRGWSGATGDARKRRSYATEAHWYRRACLPAPARTPRAVAIDEHDGRTRLLLEDLAPAYPLRQRSLTAKTIEPCLRWLACFHARHLHDAGTEPWGTGCYWHLATRREEYDAMDDGPLKRAAAALDAALADVRYSTLVHGDAKLANFLFTADGREAACVDFQYVGHGPGIRDVIYLFGSCLDEATLHACTDALLDRYAQHLIAQLTLHQPAIDAQAVADEWLGLHDVAVADFQRFLAGWAPEHAKRTDYARTRTMQALRQLGGHG